MSRIKVTVEFINGYCNIPMLVGDHLILDGSRLRIPDGGYFCMWALQSMMPIFPVLQRAEGRKGDWAGKVNRFCCPDPEGMVHYRIEKMPDDPGQEQGKG